MVVVTAKILYSVGVFITTVFFSTQGVVEHIFIRVALPEGLRRPLRILTAPLLLPGRILGRHLAVGTSPKIVRGPVGFSTAAEAAFQAPALPVCIAAAVPPNYATLAHNATSSSISAVKIAPAPSGRPVPAINTLILGCIFTLWVLHIVFAVVRIWKRRTDNVRDCYIPT